MQTTEGAEFADKSRQVFEKKFTRTLVLALNSPHNDFFYETDLEGRHGERL